MSGNMINDCGLNNMITYLVNEREILLELPRKHDVVINHGLPCTRLEPVLVCDVWPDFTLDLATKVRASRCDLYSVVSRENDCKQKNAPF